jgi:hypothetical protein
MKLFLLLSLQAAAAPAPAPPASSKVDAIRFDLARVRPADPLADCDRSDGSEIVVCGRRKAYAYPLDKMAKIYERGPLRAETGIGGGATVDVHVEDAQLGSGLISHRVMLRLKMPF